MSSCVLSKNAALPLIIHSDRILPICPCHFRCLQKNCIEFIEKELTKEAGYGILSTQRIPPGGTIDRSHSAADGRLHVLSKRKETAL